ncbi:MAG: transcriptional regulator [Candidatus Tectomicrobia bacterium]|nr:transcriptional regulator [Candidatus Tectomicrobia bacterium]
MPKSKSYHESLIESLKDPTEAAAYLTAALQDGDRAVFLLALRNVVEAYSRDIAALAEKANLNQEQFSQLFSENGHIEMESLAAVLDALGFALAIEVKRASWLL